MKVMFVNPPAPLLGRAFTAHSPVCRMLALCITLTTDYNTDCQCCEFCEYEYVIYELIEYCSIVFCVHFQMQHARREISLNNKDDVLIKCCLFVLDIQKGCLAAQSLIIHTASLITEGSCMVMKIL